MNVNAAAIEIGDTVSFSTTIDERTVSGTGIVVGIGENTITVEVGGLVDYVMRTSEIVAVQQRDNDNQERLIVAL